MKQLKQLVLCSNYILRGAPPVGLQFKMGKILRKAEETQKEKEKIRNIRGLGRRNIPLDCSLPMGQETKSCRSPCIQGGKGCEKERMDA